MAASDLSFIDSFGLDPNSVQTKANFGNVTSDIIFEWLTSLKGEDGAFNTHLKQRDVVSAGGQASDLVGSIEFQVVDAATQLHWTVTMNDYWYWVEYGRKPTTKSGGGPLGPKIEAWINKKGFSPVAWMKRINSKWKMPVKSKYTGDERYFAMKSLTSIIVHSIHTRGTVWQMQKFHEPGTGFIRRTLAKEVPKLTKKLEEALGRRITLSIKTGLKNLK